MEQGNRTLTVDSQKNCYVLPGGWDIIQKPAARAELQPGIHVLKINKGTFSFFQDGRQPQPYVLLWIAGGVFKNKASDMPVSFSWACLNGYNDTCTLEVISSTTVHALFIDCEGRDNVGQIELSISAGAR